MLFCLAGCGSAEPTETDLPESPEHPAQTDAVALIPQDGVLEIEDETGTYEVVYAEDLKEIRMDEDTNVLVSADDENFVYTFENADLVLRMMREGDVFCGILPDSGEALAIVVREIEKNGDSVTVYGVQPTLADLFETIEIEATYAPETIVVDELAEGAIIEEKAIDPSLASDRAPRAMNLAAGPFSKGEPKRIPPDHTISLGISVEADRAKVEGSISMTIETVNVSVEYRGGTMLTSVATVQTTTAFEAELAIQGGWEYDKPVGKFHIPTQIPLLTVPVSLNAYASISGSVGGKLSYQQTSVNGAEISVAGGDVAADDVDRVIRKNVDADFVNFQAEAKIGAKVAVGLSLCRGVFEAELSALVGLKAEAEYAPFEPWDEFADSCHDCGICFDGEFSAFGEIAYDVTVAFPMSTPINVGATLVEVTVPIGDFYVSLGPDGRADPRFGRGECPYRRYRTEVKVSNKFGEIYGAEVHAQYPDGRSEMKWTDEFGYAVFWLPAGENWLDAEYGGRINGDHYTIENEPSQQEIKLDFDQRVIVVYSDSLENNTVHTDRIRAQYPQAEFFSLENTGRHFYDDYGFEKVLLAYQSQLKVGDILIGVGGNVTRAGETVVEPGGSYIQDHDVWHSVDLTVVLVVQDRGEPRPLFMYGNSFFLEIEETSETVWDPSPEISYYTDTFISGIYFNGGEGVRVDAEIDESFSLISEGYVAEGKNSYGVLYKEDGTWISRYYRYWDGNEGWEGSNYIDSQEESWYKAVIDFSFECFFEQVEPLLVK